MRLGQVDTAAPVPAPAETTTDTTAVPLGSREMVGTDRGSSASLTTQQLATRYTDMHYKPACGAVVEALRKLVDSKAQSAPKVRASPPRRGSKRTQPQEPARVSVSDEVLAAVRRDIFKDIDDAIRSDEFNAAALSAFTASLAYTFGKDPVVKRRRAALRGDASE
jgi:hypothetical protein